MILTPAPASIRLRVGAALRPSAISERRTTPPRDPYLTRRHRRDRFMPPPPPKTHEGVLELHPTGYGFLRTAARNYLTQPTDPYVPGPLIQKMGLREGMRLTGAVEPGK